MARSKGTRAHDGFVRKVNGHFQGCITINGKDYRRYLNATNQRDADKAWKVLRAQLLAEHPVAERATLYAGATPFDAAFDRFLSLERKRRNVTHRLETEYRNYWFGFAKFCEGRGIKILENVTEAIANEYTLDRYEASTGSTMKKVMATLTKVWKDAMPTRPHPFTEERNEKASAKHANLTASEVNALIEAAHRYDIEKGTGSEWCNLFRLGAVTGQRLTDCAHFDIAREYDFERHIAIIHPRKIVNRKANNNLDATNITVRVPVFGELVGEIEKRANTVPVGETVPGTRRVRDIHPGTIYLMPTIAKLADGAGSQLTPHINRIFAMAGISTKPFREDGGWQVKGFHSLRVFSVTKYGLAGMPMPLATAIFGWSTVSMYARYFRSDDDILIKLGRRAFVDADGGRNVPVADDVVTD